MAAIRRTLAAGTALVAITACSTGSGGKAHPTLSSSPLPDRAGPGVVTGWLLAVGGPAGAANDPQRGRLVVRRDGRLIMTIPVAQNGRYRFDVPAGSYSIRRFSPQFNDGTEACQPLERIVRVRAGTTSPINVYCQRR
ncbi:MAG TPA: hypothetical protein VHD81_12020 [Mycobacteriales bacterium]|nr:hypothetical protein [Mycobacteriales bacterium]